MVSGLSPKCLITHHLCSNPLEYHVTFTQFSPRHILKLQTRAASCLLCFGMSSVHSFTTRSMLERCCTSRIMLLSRVIQVVRAHKWTIMESRCSPQLVCVPSYVNLVTVVFKRLCDFNLTFGPVVVC